jgi:glucan phosphorylase
MTLRYCSSCAAEVEERDGYCLLGHPVRLTAPTDSLSELRAEVDRAFEKARVEITTALEDATGEIPLVQAGLAEALNGLAEEHSKAAPTTVAHASPPPPPPPLDRRTNSIFQAVWEEQENEDLLSQKDPITAFAPAPRMDWGPKRGEEQKKSRFGRSRPKLA